MDSWRPYVAVGPARQSSARPSSRPGAPVAWTEPFPLPVSSLSRASSFPRRRRCFGELARVSPCLRSSNYVQCSASLSTPPSSSWLRLPSLGEPALPSPSRAYLAGAPPWPPAPWSGLCSPPFFLILVPKASPCHRGLFRPVSDQRRRQSAAHHRRAAIREGEVPRVQ